MEWLTKDLLAIPVKPDSVRFIDTPLNFYSVLLDRISRSKHRIVLSALYLGTGELEKELINLIKKQKRANPELSVGILLDYFRGTRLNECGLSSTDVLKNICADSQVKLFYHPDMTGALKNLLPRRLNEVVGLQHMKFFVFDNSIIISGANLSDIYFTNRQDRYMLVDDCPLLADLFCEIFDIISSTSSLSLRENGEIDFLEALKDVEQQKMHPVTGDVKMLRKEVREKIEKLFASFEVKIINETKGSVEVFDTFVYPFLQMGPFDCDGELVLLTKLFQSQQLNELEITISTGYFNLYEEYASLIFNKEWSHPLQIFFASPQANGFFGASGLAGYIPALYVHNSFEFLRRCALSKAGNGVILAEYFRPHWSYHAKGIWINKAYNSEKNFYATIIGSSNYGYRSVKRDLEAQVLLVTENEELSNKIKEERQAIAKFCKKLDSLTFASQDHFVPIWIRYFSRVFRQFF